MTVPSRNRTGTDAATLLSCAGRRVGRYVHRPRLDARLSPRPYLHPLTTLAGVPVTELMPGDHPHHLGVSIAVPDVSGANFWGGRTFVRGRGPVEPADHGEQRHAGWLLRDPDGFVEELGWYAGGAEVLRERRAVAVAPAGDGAWALGVSFALTNVSGAPVSFGSPATNGRPGAGYGGYFWRAPRTERPPRVFTAAAEGEEAVHGRPARWLALASDAWTLVFAGATDATRRDPWFVRARDYPGVGSALAWSARVPLAPGASLTRRVVTAVADGRLDRTAAAALARRAVA
ncbi:oxidoreductase [Streptomyces sp. CNQ-509]|uniref:DUF6807 domain-containing protein n=1 Tax=unclassified Streptomyces TaxID=2593676 RepID=UPI00062DFF56|nr:PmoA family protein [Streptomyces sp. CNQ-509]AKH81736.1 oxidoreductase [Streptomyces sp. CNQ-509]